MIINMTNTRRRLLQWGALAACIGPAVLAHAQDFPTKQPITIVVANVAGGAADTLARSLALELGKRLNQSVVVANVPGAAGMLGTQKVARSAPDGYTLLLASNDTVLNTITSKSPGYAVKDLTPITLLGETPLTLVARPGLPANTVDELVAQAKVKPNTFTLGITGTASIAAMAAGMLEQQGGFELLDTPYKGGAQAMVDLMGGQIDLVITALPASLGHIRANKLKGLATFSEERTPLLPELATVSESKSIKGVSVKLWAGVMGPAGMPPQVVTTLNNAFQNMLQDPAFVENQRILGTAMGPTQPQQFEKLLVSEDAKYRKVAANMKFD